VYPIQIRKQMVAITVHAEKCFGGGTQLGDEFDELIAMVKHVLPPPSTCWMDLARVAAYAWPEGENYVLIAGNGEMCRSEFIQARVDKKFALAHVYRGWNDDIRFLSPSCANMLFGVNALFPIESRIDYANLCTNVLRCHMDQGLLDDIHVDGIDNMGWDAILSIALPWLRMWRAVRTIQRAFRTCRERRRQLIYVPRLVNILRSKMTPDDV
jgi:hypothetical protein